MWTSPGPTAGFGLILAVPLEGAERAGPSRLGTPAPAVLAAASPAVHVGVQARRENPRSRERRSPCRWSRGSGEPSAASARAIVTGESWAARRRALRARGRQGTSSASPAVGTCLPGARRRWPGSGHVRRCAQRPGRCLRPLDRAGGRGAWGTTERKVTPRAATARDQMPSSAAPVPVGAGFAQFRTTVTPRVALGCGGPKHWPRADCPTCRRSSVAFLGPGNPGPVRRTSPGDAWHGHPEAVPRRRLGLPLVTLRCVVPHRPCPPELTGSREVR